MLVQSPLRSSEYGNSHVTVLIASVAGLAAAMGVGRFAYTPLLPLMTDQTALSHTAGAAIATANYAGYLLGAIGMSVRPRWAQSRALLLISSAVLVISEVGMPLVTDPWLWSLLRLVAGIASAVLFVGCVQRVARLRGDERARAMYSGIGFSGVGMGIAITGVVALVLRSHADWREIWLVLALITILLLAPLIVSLARSSTNHATLAAATPGTADRRLSGWLLINLVYFLEGVGYIIIGTFLVAAVVDTAGEEMGPIAWIVVGIAAAPGTIVWTQIGRRFGTRPALAGALACQAVGAVVPAASGSAAAAMLAAILFGGTFMGITALSIQVGTEIHGPDAAAPLTASYGLGQILGPIAVTPVLGSAYVAAFGIAAGTLAVAMVLALAVRWRHKNHAHRVEAVKA